VLRGAPGEAPCELGWDSGAAKQRFPEAVVGRGDIASLSRGVSHPPPPTTEGQWPVRCAKQPLLPPYILVLTTLANFEPKR